jgi:hypothetical protein
MLAPWRAGLAIPRVPIAAALTLGLVFLGSVVHRFSLESKKGRQR